ncbi:ubiquitin-activating enzyme, putative [Plasmodium vivax]|uniref:Ubiquitin-activating enzyme, putative n=1 Tax=Plasmodium vivax TaxID=5855 RepID=A0A564ZX36_PLAVI|nr:ubiquitin-activating enzyme, putative [Plasmodium vivax]
MGKLLNEQLIKCGVCFLLGFYIKEIAEWGSGKKKKASEMLKWIRSKVETVICPYMLSSRDYTKVQKMEGDLFYKNFDKQIIDKYGKYMNIQDIPPDSLEKIFQTKVLIVGLGGLGSPVCLYLTKFGFKEIGLIDGDKVEESNLQRQIIHAQKHTGMNKTLSAKLTVKNMGNDDANIKCYPFYLDKTKGLQIVKNYDIVVDCTDNIATRFLINDLCVLYRKKLIFGSALGLYGQLNVFNMTKETSNCYRCLQNFNNHTEGNDCDENGILSTVAGIIGILQANEVIKLSANLHQESLQNFLTYNSLSSRRPFETLNMNRKNPNCVCAWGDSAKLREFIERNDYQGGGGNTIDPTCVSGKGMPAYQYDIGVPHFLEVLNKDFSFFQFPVDHLCILDVRKYNNANVYGLKDSIKWSFYDIMESLNNYANSSIHLTRLILEKLEISKRTGNVVIIVICRRGIDSLKVAKYFNNFFLVDSTEGSKTSPPQDSSPDASLKICQNQKTANKSEFQDKQIFTYNMRGGYLELQKRVFKNLPFL